MYIFNNLITQQLIKSINRSDSMKTKEIPISTRDLVISTWQNESISLMGIAKRFNLPKSTVQGIIERFKKTGTVQNAPGRGKAKTFTPRETRTLLREVNDDPFKSAIKLAEIMKQSTGKVVTPKTITNYLKQEGVRARTPRKKPFVSAKNKLKRLEFARKNLNQPERFWKRILWTDETKINLFGSDGHQKVWRRSGEALQSKNLRPTVKHGGGSVLLWGSMAADGVGNLEFIDGIMNADAYVGILERNMKSSARKLGLGRNFMFQQDNDPKHTSKKAREFFQKNKQEVLEWPPQSPDLNPIEHLWEHLKRKLWESNVSSKKALKDLIVREWEVIDASVTRNLVDSMQRRLEAVIAANGGATKY